MSLHVLIVMATALLQQLLLMSKVLKGGKAELPSGETARQLVVEVGNIGYMDVY